MPNIKSPFNFVPVSEKVYFPDWSEQISYDVPFSDGISGTIHLHITTHTPTFVRNGHTKEDAEKKYPTYNSFSKIANRYFIPATSIKGEVRNILEILSFSKMDIDRSSLFAQREWDNTKLYTLKTNQSEVRCGWLRRKGNDYEIINCGKPYRISHKRIDEFIGENVMENLFSERNGINLNEKKEEKDPKTAIFKYELMKKKGIDLTNLSFEIDEEACNSYNTRRVLVSDNGTIEGTIVLTGQPDRWAERNNPAITRPKGKYYEFVFANNEEVINGKKAYDVSKETFDHYKFIYQDSVEWQRIKVDIETKQGVPVFFRVEDNKIKDFGMAFLYKLPYEKSPFEVLPNAHKIETPDLAQCIFGYTSKNKSLKGRVQFGHAFSNDAQSDKDITLTLNTPKASYYPIYIQQEGRNGIVTRYETYNDGKLSGWKRYHIRKKTWEKAMNSEKLDTIIHPVKKGSTFHGSISFHNLRPVELGALLSALTFHGTSGCYHSIGQGKPYGFGKVTYNIELDCDNNNNEIEYYMSSFEYTMGQHTSWIGSEQVTTLLTIAANEVEGTPFEYMTMEMGGTNEFILAKSNNEYLTPAKQILEKRILPQSLYERGEEIQEKEKKNIKDSYLKLFEEIQGMTREEEAFRKFDEIIAELTKKFENEQNEDWREFYQTEKIDWINKRKDLEAKFTADENKQNFITGLATYLTALTSYGVWENRIKKWEKWCEEYDGGRSTLTEEEKQAAKTRLVELFKDSKKADQKKFKWGNASKILGEEVNPEILNAYIKQ
jgi:CRISPR-associated protein